MKTPARPPSHTIGDVGQTAVALLLKRWGWTADPIASDYGEDVDCTIYVDGRRTALHFRCQVKSSTDADKTVRQLKSGVFSIKVQATTCTAWALSYFPVLLMIHDEDSGEIYWTDATSQIRSRLTVLAQQTVTLHVPRNSLVQDQERVVQTVSGFYAGLLRLSHPLLQCEIYPILMPGYRALPFIEILRAVPGDVDHQISIESTSTDQDSLPSWGTALRVLEGPFLHGWQVSSAVNALAPFLSAVKGLLGTLKLTKQTGEWISFVVAPTHFRVRGDEQDFWNRELVGWWSYTLVNGSVRADADHAFATPPGFLKQIARRARSWNGHWSVNPHLDLAIEFFAAAPTTPSYRAQQSALRQHALGQFLPWQCRDVDVDSLRQELITEELLFHEVRGEGISPPDGIIFGAIAHPMFDPTIGLIPQANGWAEFASGSVRVKVRDSGLQLSGEEGPPEISEFVMSFFGPDFGDAPETALVTGFNFVPGLPLDHSKRLIRVQRFRKIERGSIARLEKAMIGAGEVLRRDMHDCISLDVSYNVLQTLGAQVVGVSVSWDPELVETSMESYARHQAFLVRLFDAVLPRHLGDTNKNPETLDILRYDGELYFEGDDWWPFSRRTDSP